jgi:hypothetical protein
MAGEPTDAELIRLALDSRLLDVHTCMPGRVLSYTAATQTANVVPVVRRAIARADGSYAHEDLPVLHNVPVIFPRGGGCSFVLPVAAGDHVWLMFSESAMAQWRSTGQTANPGDVSRHDLSYPVALPGMFPSASPVGASGLPLGSEAVVTELRVGSPAAQAVALATLVSLQLQALMASIASAASTEGTNGGTGGMTALSSALGLLSWPGDVAATKLTSD